MHLSPEEILLNAGGKKGDLQGYREKISPIQTALKIWISALYRETEFGVLPLKAPSTNEIKLLQVQLGHIVNLN